MENLKLRIKDEKLVIEIDLSAKGRLSKSGRSVVIASTLGNLPLVEADGTYRKERLNLSLSRPISQNELGTWPGDDLADTT